MSNSTTDSTALRLETQPNELLQYLAAYKVVICMSCQYALQPDGISRHLKDIHHIYRSRRRPFMKYVSQLYLDKPQNVNKPHPRNFPVPLLPVKDGLQCEAEGCSHLCISVKRMKSHWVSIHSRQGQSDRDWRSVPLQTFFQGNLLKYFTNVPSRILSTDAITVMNKHNEADAKNKNICYEQIAFCNLPASKSLEQNDEVNIALLSTIDEFHHCISLDEFDKALLDHYITSTSLTIATNEDTKILWQTTVTHLANHHRFLMHGILACSALHLAYHNSTSERNFAIRARTHQDLAMPLFRTAITNVNNENCDAVLVFSHLLVIYSFSSEKQDERLLLVEPNDPGVLPSWLYFLRSGCSMLCSVWDRIEFGPVKALASAWDIPITILEEHKLGAHQHLYDFFLSLIPPPTLPDAWSEEASRLYQNAAKELDAAFACTRALGETFTTWDALRIWPMRISVEYMDLLCAGRPDALVLLARYCLLLKKLETNWYFEGRATRLLSTV